MRKCSVCGTILSKKNKSKNKCYLHSRRNVTVKLIANFYKEKKDER